MISKIKPFRLWSHELLVFFNQLLIKSILQVYLVYPRNSSQTNILMQPSWFQRSNFSDFDHMSIWSILQVAWARSCCIDFKKFKNNRDIFRGIVPFWLLALFYWPINTAARAGQIFQKTTLILAFKANRMRIVSPVKLHFFEDFTTAQHFANFIALRKQYSLVNFRTS